MQLEYLFRVKNHERYNQTCVIIHYSPLSNNDDVTIMFPDGTTIDTNRIHIISKDTVHRRKRKKKMHKVPHEEYNVQIKFDTSEYNRQKLKRYLKQHNITSVDLFNTFISNL